MAKNRGAVTPEPDVKVHHKGGCELDGRRDQHTHTQAAHRAHLDRTGDPVTGRPHGGR